MRRVTRIFVACTLLALAAVAAGYASSAAPTKSNASAGAARTDRAALMAAHRGGTLNLLAKAAGGSIDPQVNYTLEYWQLFQATYDGLLAFTKAGGDAAFQVVPDIAESIPTPTNGGKTWVFKIRKGIKFSNGKTVTPADVVASFQRIFKVKSPTSGTFYAGIVGAKACLKTPATCTLKGGVTANDKAGTVTIQPDGARLRVQVPGRRAAREHRSGGFAAEGCRHEAAPRYGCLLLRLVRHEQAAGHEAQPVLQAVVEGCPA